MACENEVSLIAFPELSLTGYTCGDLFLQNLLMTEAEEGIRKIAESSRGRNISIVVGAPVPYRNKLYNCAIVISDGKICGIVPKTYVTDSERRWFVSGNELKPSEMIYAGQKCTISSKMLFKAGNAMFAAEIGEDMWAAAAPSTFHALEGAHIIANISADKEVLMRDAYRKQLLCQHSARTHTGYIYASAGFGESTQDHVFAGAAYIWENGEQMAENERYSMTPTLIMSDIDIERLEFIRRSSSLFTHPDQAGCRAEYTVVETGVSVQTDFESDLHRYIEPHPFAPEREMEYRCSEIISIQVAGLVKRLSHINCRTAVIGVSGGLDSTLALLVTALAFDKLGWSHDRIIAVTMPGFGTTSRTKNNAWELMKALGVTCREISIVPAVEQHFKDISHDSSVHDATYENSQARERTQIIMDIANQTNGIVVGTGDLSELALGWATYNGDHMSMYGVNAGIPKTLVRGLVKWAAVSMPDSVRDILLDIVDTPISPELLPANDKGEIQQVTEDLVGPYELHDFFIYNFIRNGYTPEKILFMARKAFGPAYDDETLLKWMKNFVRRFFNQQFKRSCMPDGPAVGTVTLSPRGGWSMPSDAWSSTFASNIK